MRPLPVPWGLFPRWRATRKQCKRDSVTFERFAKRCCVGKNVSNVALFVLNPMLGSVADDGIMPQPSDDIRALAPSDYSASVMAPDISKVDTDRHLDPGPSPRSFRGEVLRFFMGNSLSDPKHLLIPFIGTVAYVTRAYPLARTGRTA